MSHRETKVVMLASAGNAWGLAEEVAKEMAAVQQALLRGDTRLASEHYDRGRRLAKRLSDGLAPVDTATALTPT